MKKSKKRQFRKTKRSKKSKKGAGPKELTKGKRYTVSSLNGMFKGRLKDTIYNEENPQYIFKDVRYMNNNTSGIHSMPQSNIIDIMSETDSSSSDIDENTQIKIRKPRGRLTRKKVEEKEEKVDINNTCFKNIQVLMNGYGGITNLQNTEKYYNEAIKIKDVNIYHSIQKVIQNISSENLPKYNQTGYDNYLAEIRPIIVNEINKLEPILGQILFEPIKQSLPFAGNSLAIIFASIVKKYLECIISVIKIKNKTQICLKEVPIFKCNEGEEISQERTQFVLNLSKNTQFYLPIKIYNIEVMGMRYDSITNPYDEPRDVVFVCGIDMEVGVAEIHLDITKPLFYNKNKDNICIEEIPVGETRIDFIDKIYKNNKQTLTFFIPVKFDGYYVNVIKALSVRPEHIPSDCYNQIPIYYNSI